MAGYDFAAIEKKWQEYWDKHGTFVQPNPGEQGFVERPKYYVLDMFPYPSGAGLHVGHPEGYTATDIVARYRRMQGFNVLHPMGYDSFGLPAEQYAVEQGVHPRVTTARNIANIERQIKMFGFSYDWSRRVATTDVEYYRWTQWIFLQLYNSWFDPQANAARPIAELEAKLQAGLLVVDLNGDVVPNLLDNKIPEFNLQAVGVGQLKFYELEDDQKRRLIDEYRLAYQAEVPVNWCPMLGTVLANEEVTNEGRSDRGNFPVYRRPLRQWMLRITAYAERLIDDLDLLDWPEPIKAMQRNWIGKSVGAEVDFPLESLGSEEWFESRHRGFPAVPEDEVIRVFTTRPDTLYGATYMVLAPEHELVAQITTPEQKHAVEAYVQAARNKSELERTAESKDKTGVFTGAYAINPVTREAIPIWVADYVMMGYGTGAIMAVPAHDTRDMEFAEKFGLPIVQVVQPPAGKDWRGFVDDGIAINSAHYDGLATEEFKKRITHDLHKTGLGKEAVNYKLRDWLFSRQRYWGEPFPIIHCPNCGTIALPEDALPLTLPEMDDFSPAASDDPNALPSPPLAKAKEWVNTTCPRCGQRAKRETNTMPQWAGSCWYFLRYLDPRNDKQLVDPAIEKYWMGRGTAALGCENAGKPARPTVTIGKEEGRVGTTLRRMGETPMPHSKKGRHGGVDLYVGGAEHAVLHLLYARFWHKVLYDLGHVSTAEPFGKLFNQGMIRSFAYRDRRGMCIGYDEIDFSGDKPRLKGSGEELTESVEKMSKSLKNVVNPDQVIAGYGADTFRLYEMFMGPLDASKPWNTRDVPGVHRFCQRVWRMICGLRQAQPALSSPKGGSEDQGPLVKDQADEQVEKALHKLIKKVGEDVEAMKFNTAIAAMMEFVNLVYKAGAISKNQAERFVLVVAPFTPHLAEELWSVLGHSQSLAHEAWPKHDEALLEEQTVELPVQVNGKIRSRIIVPVDATQEQVLDIALADAKVASSVEGKTVVKRIVVPGRMVNIVVK